MGLARRTAPQIEKVSLFYADERDEGAEEVGDAAVVLLLRRRRSRDVDDDLPHRSREDEAMLGKPEPVWAERTVVVATGCATGCATAVATAVATGASAVAMVNGWSAEPYEG